MSVNIPYTAEYIGKKESVKSRKIMNTITTTLLAFARPQNKIVFIGNCYKYTRSLIAEFLKRTAIKVLKKTEFINQSTSLK
ncbi:MAG: hypothetical protein AAF579_10215 [Cyanobacteria bacterium P01_C01_bin.118]